MSIYNFVPEGWNNEITKINSENIKTYIANKNILQGLVRECDNNYDLHIEFDEGIEGIIPRKEIEAINLQENGLPKERLCIGKVHKFVQFTIEDIDKNNKLILSRKNVQENAIKWIKDDLNIGQRVTGIVKSVKPYGVFVEIGGGVVGLVHIEDLSISRIRTPFERVNIGQKIEVVVKYINRENGKIILSHKETLGTWEENAKKFKIGKKVKGKVKETEKNKKRYFYRINT